MRPMMKKLGLLVPMTLCLIALVATPALAGSELPPPRDPVGGITIVQAPSGLSFTGANVSVWMVLAVGLLLIGVALLIAGRRRRASAVLDAPFETVQAGSGSSDRGAP